MTLEHIAICVTAAWNDWRSAHARLDDLHDVHWHQPAGAPRPIIHAFVACADIVSGDLPHACDRASAPHRVRVCVLRRHNVASAYAELVRKADLTRAFSRRPASAYRVRRVDAAAMRRW